jgi:putative redox protein
MTDENLREITVTRLRKARFVARNERGGELEFGEGDDEAFTPVELLLAAISGCNAIDVDYITAKRAEADRFEMSVSARKIRDEHGNRLVDIRLRFDVDFPDTDGGAAAQEVLPSAVRRSRDRLCTVGRTVVVGTPVTVVVDGIEESTGEAR